MDTTQTREKTQIKPKKNSNSLKETFILWNCMYLYVCVGFKYTNIDRFCYRYPNLCIDDRKRVLPAKQNIKITNINFILGYTTELQKLYTYNLYPSNIPSIGTWCFCRCGPTCGFMLRAKWACEYNTASWCDGNCGAGR